MRELLRRIGYYLRRRRFEAELEEEMAYHRELSGEKRFGNTTRLKEESRAIWGWPTLDSAARDLRYGTRRLLRSPGFAVVAILSLALGIGANSAVFQLVNAVRLRPLPVPDARELVEIHIDGGNGGFGRNTGWNSLTYPIWEQIRDNQEGLEAAFAWARTQMELGEEDAPREVEGAWVTGETFAALGVTAQRGRLLDVADDQPGCPAVAVISDGLWHRDFGGGADAIGSELTVRENPVTIVGVTTPDFFGIEVGRPVDVYMPFCVIGQWTPGLLQSREWFWLGAMGRLAPDWTVQGVAAQLETASAGWLAAVAPDGYAPAWMERWSRFRLTAEPRPNGISEVREVYGAALWLLFGITALVLLIACTNLANLMVARSAARGREISVRLAIGASRARVLWQLFWESLLLAVGGAVVGVALATLLSEGLVRFIQSQASWVGLDVPIDWRVLAFVTASALFICIGLAMFTGLFAVRGERRLTVATGGRGGGLDRRSLAFQRPLIAFQVAVSLALVVSSLLFGQSFRNLLARDAGFRQEGVALHGIDVGSGGSAAALRPMLTEVLANARATPGLKAVSTSTHVPLAGGRFSLAVRTLGGEEIPAYFSWLSPRYFETVEIPMLAGRDFTDADDAGSDRVVVVNETFARRFLDGVEPIGRTVRSIAEPGYPAAEYRVVGVVADSRYYGLKDPIPPVVYGPDAQTPNPARSPYLVTRSGLSAPEAAAALGTALARVAPEVRIGGSIDIRGMAVGQMARERLLAWIAGLFGALALGLAAIGLYGVVSCVVEGRRAEIGIRMALGASRSGVAWMVVRQVGILLAVGLILGSVLVFAMSGAASSLLVDLEPTDPLTLAAAAALLVLVAVWSAVGPARRASRVDPQSVLSE
jgi:predicted permease